MSEENQKSISQSISETATAASNAVGGLYDKATGKATEPEHELPTHRCGFACLGWHAENLDVLWGSFSGQFFGLDLLGLFFKKN
jgi:hypothetical protein